MDALQLPPPPPPKVEVPGAPCPYCDALDHGKEFHVPSASSGAAQMVCPHCQTKGFVITSQQKVKKGISGGKATGAVLTAGISLLATGLSRKEWVTVAYCSNCQARWQY